MRLAKRHARVAALKRHRSPDDPQVHDAVRELRAACLAAHIREVVDSAPPLTDEQRTRLALLLNPSNSADEVA